MALSLDSLINQLVPLKTSRNSDLSAIKSRILEATVLTTTKLLSPTQAGPQFRVTLSLDNQQLEITTKAPLPQGTQLQLKINNDGSAVILKLLGRPSDPATGNSTATASARQTTTTAQPAATLLTGTEATTAKPTPQQLIDHSLRQSLPQQQALKELLPLLLRIVQQPPPQLPANISQSVQALLKLFPSPSQLQQPAALQQAVRNSGIFLEAKLADATKLPTTTSLREKTPSQPGVQPSNSSVSHKTDISSDLKLATQRLVRQLEQATASATTSSAKSPGSISGSTASSILSASTESELPEIIYTAKALTPKTAQQSTASENKQDNLDILLRQLGKQLLSGLARTQMNQLESLGNRQALSADPQNPVNSWVLEIPIMQGENVDNLELRIDEQHNDDEEDEKKQQQWTVMLAFDLHALGKMNVQLKIIQSTVAATVWSQLEHTHQEVRQQLKSLRNNLEKVGVNVTQVDCYHGLPPKNLSPVHQQLVDVRT